MSFKDKFLKMYRSDRVYLAEWILVIVTGIFVFVTACTWDLQSLTIWSTNVWDVIADGRPRELYAYTIENVYGVHHDYMGSELMSVLPWSIWNLPIWILQRFFGKPIIDSAVMLAYSKLFLVLIEVVMLIYAKKIAEHVTGDKNKAVWAVFLSAGSTYLYLSVCYQGQNDILMMCASVLAINALLKNKEKAFVGWSALAIAIKPFFVLPFLAVLMLYEKRVLRILGKTLAAVSGLIAQKLLFMGAPGYSESMNSGPAKQMLEDMFPKNLYTSFGDVSFFAIALVLIYFYCYTRGFKRSDLKDKRMLLPKYIVYIITVVYTAYLMFSPFSFYRLATLTPFLYIVLVQNRKMYLYNSIFDIAMQLGLLMKLVLRGSTMFQIRFVNKALVQRFFGYYVKYKESDNFASIDKYLYAKNDLFEKYQKFFAGISVVSAVMLLVLNHPEEKIKLKVSGDRHVRALAWARILLIIPFAALTVYLFAKTANRVYY